MRIDMDVFTEVQQGIDPKTSIDYDKEIKDKAERDNIGILRMYNWSPTGITLGANQNPDQINIEKAQEVGIPVVRRDTNGGALMISDGDWVMSLAIGSRVFNRPLRGLRIYCMFQGILKGALEDLGVLSDRARDEEATVCKTAECFGSLDRGELVDLENRKIFGGGFSSYTTYGYFQQGYIPLTMAHSQLPTYVKKLVPSAVEQGHLATYNIDFTQLSLAFIENMYRMYPEWRP